MHLVIPTHLFLFWVVCHLSRTFLPKDFEQPPSPHRQTTPSLTSSLWTTTPILAGYKLVVPEPYAYSTSMCVHVLSIARAFAMTWRLVCTFCNSFLTYCGVNGSLSLCFLYLTSFLGWPYLIMGFSFSNPFFSPFAGLLALLSLWETAPSAPFYRNVGPNPREWVELCYCLSKWRFD